MRRGTGSRTLLIAVMTAAVLVASLTTYVSPARAAADEPPLMLGQRMVYDPVIDRVILFGGSFQSGSLVVYGDTWSLNVRNATWNKLSPSSGPTPRFGFGFTYDSDTRKIVLFGGYSALGRLKDTWIYDTASNTWENTSPLDSPSKRNDFAMSYDVDAKKIILFGGYLDDDSPSEETWSYDVSSNTWTRMSPESHPPARYDGTMVYDTYTKRTLLFGGHLVTGGYENEVWAYDYASDSWERLTVSNKPAMRYCHGTVYDSKLNRMVIFGGTGVGDATFDDTWIYSCRNQTWSRVALAVHPEGREFPSLAYDSSSGKVVLFGGVKLNDTPTPIYYNGTWVFDQSGSWGRLEAESVKPQPATTQQIPAYPCLAVLIGVLVSVYLIRRTPKSISPALSVRT
jgi:N-acetylneuraminic acid mutarotase